MDEEEFWSFLGNSDVTHWDKEPWMRGRAEKEETGVKADNNYCAACWI